MFEAVTVEFEKIYLIIRGLVDGWLVRLVVGRVNNVIVLPLIQFVVSLFCRDRGSIDLEVDFVW